MMTPRRRPARPFRPTHELITPGGVVIAVELVTERTTGASLFFDPDGAAAAWSQDRAHVLHCSGAPAEGAILRPLDAPAAS